MEFTEQEKEMIFNALGNYLSILETEYNEDLEVIGEGLEKELRESIELARRIATKIDPNNRYY